MAKKKTESYQAAMEELQDIVEAIENEEIMVDELAAKVKRASEIIQFCGAKLRDAEEEVSKVLNNDER